MKSIRYRGWISKTFLGLFTISFLGLMYLGMQPAQGIYVTLSRIFCGAVFRVLPADAVLFAHRSGQARARASHRSMA